MSCTDKEIDSQTLIDRLHERCIYYTRTRSQQELYQFYQYIKVLDAEDLASLLSRLFHEANMSGEFLNYLGFYRTLLLSKCLIPKIIADQMEEHHISMMIEWRRLCFVDPVDFSVYVLKNVNLARTEGYFSSDKSEITLKAVLSFKLRSFNPGDSDDRYVLRFYTECFKLLRNLNMGHDVPGLLGHVQNILSGRPSVADCFKTLIDMEDIKPRTAFIDNSPDDLFPLLSLLIIHASLAFLSSGLDYEEFCKWIFGGFYLGMSNSELYPTFFKIFATDTDAMYEALNLLMAQPRPEGNPGNNTLNPVQFYSVMVHGAENGQSFYENHIRRNPDGMQFTFSMLKRINQQRCWPDDIIRSPASYALHSSLRDHLQDLMAEDKLHFNPAPYLKQLNLFLSTNKA